MGHFGGLLLTCNAFATLNPCTMLTQHLLLSQKQISMRASKIISLALLLYFVSAHAQNHEYVDLGLGVKWATCNVGADKPEDYGDYFAWGEIEPKESYTWENYRFRTSGYDEGNVKYSKYTSIYYSSMESADHRIAADDKTKLDLKDDVAHVKWGGNWRVPTDQEMFELIDSCTWTWTTVNGVNGYRVISNRPGFTDRSIFLPATGTYAWNPNNTSVGTWGHYWSSSVNRDKISHSAGVLVIGSNYRDVKKTFRFKGQTIRPVYSEIGIDEYEEPEMTTEDTVPENPVFLSIDEELSRQHEYVDLGLSVNWATCNVGADKPEEYGIYLAWGEIEPKTVYRWENYRFRMSGDNFFTNIRFSKYNMNSSSGVVDSLTTLEMIDDAAHVRWGGSWRMPTVYEFYELMVNCTWTWTTINGVNGYKITSNMPGYTDRSIFLPAVGLGYAPFNKRENNEGIYWSSSLRPSTPGMPNSPYIISFASGGFSLGAGTQQKGYPIRPVCPNEKYENVKSPVGISADVDLPVLEGVIMPF